MKGGVKYKSHKYLSTGSELTKVSPDFVAISLSNSHIGSPAVPIIKIGDAVKKGQLIANKGEGFSANLHASVSGIVTAIELRESTNGGKTQCIIIKNDKQENEWKFTTLTDPAKEQIIQRIADAGIVGLGGAGFPTEFKLTASNIDTLILNGVECEDYLSADDYIMKNKTREMLEGGCYLAKALSLDSFVVAVKKDKKEAIEKLTKELETFTSAKVILKLVETKYPAGFEKTLIKEVTGRIVKLKDLPATEGVVVQNVSTALAVYEAIKLGKPLYERVVTVSGKAVKNPGNFLVPNGSTIKDLFDAAGGEVFDKNTIDIIEEEAMALYTIEAEMQLEIDEFSKSIEEMKTNSSKEFKNAKNNLKHKRNELKAKKKQNTMLISDKLKKMRKDFDNVLAKVVVGGPFMGEAQDNMEASVSKKMSGILFMSASEIDMAEETQCINCLRCINVCPMKLKPNELDEAAEFGREYKYHELNLWACIECGCCSFICPAKRHIASRLRMVKKGAK